MKQLLFILSFVGICLAGSAQEVKTKSKTEYKKPSTETKVVTVHTASHKAYATHHVHHVVHKKHYVHHPRKVHHVVIHKKHSVMRHPYKKVKMKRENGETKTVHKT